MARWRESENRQPEFQPDPALGLSEFLVRLLAERGITGNDEIRAFLDPDYYQPSPADEIPGMAEGIREVKLTIKSG